MDIKYIELTPLEDEQLAGVETEEPDSTEWQVHPEKDGTYWVSNEDTFIAGDMTLENARLLAAGSKMLAFAEAYFKQWDAIKRLRGFTEAEFLRAFPKEAALYLHARAAIVEATRKE